MKRTNKRHGSDLRDLCIRCSPEADKEFRRMAKEDRRSLRQVFEDLVLGRGGLKLTPQAEAYIAQIMGETGLSRDAVILTIIVKASRDNQPQSVGSRRA